MRLMVMMDISIVLKKLMKYRKYKSQEREINERNLVQNTDELILLQ